jgi:hypothetical protein
MLLLEKMSLADRKNVGIAYGAVSFPLVAIIVG